MNPWWWQSPSKGLMFLFQCVKLMDDSEPLPLLKKVFCFTSKCLAGRLYLVLFLSVTENNYLSMKLMVQFVPNYTADTERCASAITLTLDSGKPFHSCALDWFPIFSSWYISRYCPSLFGPNWCCDPLMGQLLQRLPCKHIKAQFFWNL